MDFGLSGRRALVCAASKGLGRGCAEALALEGVRRSQAHVVALLEREFARGIAPGRTLLAGFSQGAAIALYAGLRSE